MDEKQEAKREELRPLENEQAFELAKQAHSFLSRNDIYRIFLWKKFLEASVSASGEYNVKTLREAYQAVLGFLMSVQNDVLQERQRQANEGEVK